MRRAIGVVALAALAGCGSKAPQTAQPRVPRVEYKDYAANPQRYARYLALCNEIAGSGRAIRAEINNCRLLKADANLRYSEQLVAQSGAATNPAPGAK